MGGNTNGKRWTIATSVVSWAISLAVVVWVAGGMASQQAQHGDQLADHEERIRALEQQTSIVTEIRTDVRWIKEALARERTDAR